MSCSRSNSPRLLLGKVRSGDFAHPGDEEAINITFKILKDLNNKKTFHKHEALLDVGCGYGGTADYIQKQNIGSVWGVDVDEQAISYAAKKYSDVIFLTLDLFSSHQNIDLPLFDIIFLFNVFYNLDFQEKAFRVFAEHAKPGATLIIFDYKLILNDQLDLSDLAGKKMRPINMRNILDWMKDSGWTLIHEEDVSDKYLFWYTTFLEKLSQQKTNLLKEFDLNTFEKVYDVFSKLVEKIKQKQLGGTILYAKYDEKLNLFKPKNAPDNNNQQSLETHKPHPL